MKSIRRTAPPGIFSLQDQRIRLIATSETEVPSAGGSAGPINQRPCSALPNSAAKQASLSNLGQQSQSIEPVATYQAAGLTVPYQCVVL